MKWSEFWKALPFVSWPACFSRRRPVPSLSLFPSYIWLYWRNYFFMWKSFNRPCSLFREWHKKKKPIQMWSTVNDCLPLSHDSRLRFPVSRPECHLWALGGFVGISRTHAALHGFLLFICNCKRFFEGEKKETIVSALLSLAQLCSLFSALCQREWEPRLSTSL